MAVCKRRIKPRDRGCFINKKDKDNERERIIKKFMIQRIVYIKY